MRLHVHLCISVQRDDVSVCRSICLYHLSPPLFVFLCLLVIVSLLRVAMFSEPVTVFFASFCLSLSVSVCENLCVSLSLSVSLSLYLCVKTCVSPSLSLSQTLSLQRL